MIECVNCGARINKEDVKCPYCGAMQYDAAEKQYMEKLYSLEEGMDRLDDDARESISKSMLKCALITLAAAAAAVFIGILSGYARYYQYYTSYGDFLNAKESIDWYDNNIDSIEECYSRREFAAIRDKLNSGESVISHRALKNWEHYPLCVAYSDTYYEFERTKPSDNGNYKGYEFTVKYRAAIYTIAIESVKDSSQGKIYAKCTETDKEIMRQWIDEAEKFLTEEAGIDKARYEADIADIYSQNHSYPDYAKIQEYAKKYYQTYAGNLNGGTL